MTLTIHALGRSRRRSISNCAGQFGRAVLRSSGTTLYKPYFVGTLETILGTNHRGPIERVDELSRVILAFVENHR